MPEPFRREVYTGQTQVEINLLNRAGAKVITNEINDQQTFSLSLSVRGKASARRCSRVYIKRRVVHGRWETSPLGASEPTTGCIPLT